MEEAHWYAVHTYSGYENKVKTNIDKTIENRHLEEQILEVRIPLQDVTEVRNGKDKTVQKKLFPGYVLVHMIMNESNWYIVRNTRGVTGFVGSDPKNPVALSEKEIFNLSVMSANVEVDFKVGDTVKVVNGIYKDKVSAIESVNASKQTVTINVELFGRERPVEVDISDIRKF